MRTLACLFIAGAATSAAAQTVPGPDTAFYRLPAVIVHVTRVPLRALDAPFAITVVPVSAFASTNGLRADQALRNVPGVLAQSRYGGSDVRIVVRGFGARGAGDRSNAGTTRGVRIMQDGFPETEPDGRTALDLVDLAAVERVEVVRSNASALWGNAGGGLINFSTIPDAAAPVWLLGLQSGAFGLRRAIGTFHQELNAPGQIYGTVVRTDFDGWRTRSASERTVANIGLVAPVGAGTELRVHALAADNAFDIPGPLTRAEFDADPRQANATYAQRFERRRNRMGRLGLAIDHEWAPERSVSGTLYVNPKYLQRSERGTYRDFTRSHVGGSALYRMAHALPAKYQGSLAIGVDEAYQDGAILFYSLTPNGERGSMLRDDKREGANNFGVFAQDVMSFGRLDVTVGARYDVVSYYYDNHINPRLDANISFKHVTPKLGLLYKLSPDHTVYTNIGGGVEAPAGNETDPVGTFGTDTITAINPLLEPIYSTTVEVGTKRISALHTGFLRAVAYDIALYRTGVINEIVPYRGGRFYFTAGRAERRGAELGVSASTARGIDIRTSLTFSHNRYNDYQVDSVHYGRPGRFADYSGNRIVGIPDRFFTIDAQYKPAFLDWVEMEAELQHVGGYFADDANAVAVPAYSLFNVGLGLRQALSLGGGFGLRGYVRAENVAGKHYIGSAFLNPDMVDGVPVAFEPGTPRHAVVNLSISKSGR